MQSVCGSSIVASRLRSVKHKRADGRTIYAFRTRIDEHFYSGNDDEAVEILGNDSL
jgi:hypothetical protein